MRINPYEMEKREVPMLSKKNISKAKITRKMLHKFRNYLLIGGLVLVPFFMGGCGMQEPSGGSDPSQAVIPSPTPAFGEFATGIFVEEVTSDTISLHYTLSEPEAYGITEMPITFGSVEDAVSFDENVVTWYEQLLGYSDSYKNGSMTQEEQRTYDALMRYLELMLKHSFSPYLSELLGPTTGYQAQLPIILAEYRFDTRADVEQYLMLLERMDDYFKEIAEFEKAKSAAGYFMSDETAKEIIAQCEQFLEDPDSNFLLTTFEERLEPLELSTSEKTELVLQNQKVMYSSVFPAYDLLAEALTECLGTGKNALGLCYFEGGREFYELLLQISTGTDRSTEAVKVLLLEAIADGCNAMAVALAKEPAIYDSALAPDYPETDPAKIMDFIKEKAVEDFPAIDCNGCGIKYIPEALQDFVSPAMYVVPPIDNYRAGTIYINQSPIYSPEALFPTIAHEGYPGHLYQTVASLSGNTHPLRHLLAPTGYQEGWATYAEIYCYKYADFSDALISFLQADQIATLCLYAISDIYIHYDGYTPEQLSTFLADYGFPEESAALIYQVLIAEPGAYLPYAVGCLEFLELKETAAAAWGADYSDYRFHEFLLEMGPMGFGELNKMLSSSPTVQ